ncbi:MAG: hypothetical protein GXP62_15565, partial [Oligoflexia bacterium]|nr:hypothetical protein [Oligoflexia bacterium]
LGPRIDLYASVGLKPWLQVSAWLPVVATFALSDDSTGPCPDQGPAGFCDPAYGIGKAGAELRAGMLGGDLSLTPALALTSDLWNSGSRGQYTSLGTAVVSVIPGIYIGYEKGLGNWRPGIVAHANYAWNVGRRRIDTGPDAPLQAPANDIIEAIEIKLGLPLPLEISGALEGAQRQGGLDWEGDYYANYWVDNADRWAVLRYQELVVRGKLSIALPNDMGLHFQAGKVIDVRNGPPDTWDFGVGWHKYFAPRSG